MGTQRCDLCAPHYPYFVPRKHHIYTGYDYWSLLATAKPGTSEVTHLHYMLGCLQLYPSWSRMSPFCVKDKQRIRVKEWKKIFQELDPESKRSSNIHIWTIWIQTIIIQKRKRRSCGTDKGTIQQEEIIVNKYTPNASVYNVIKQTTKHRKRDRLKHNNSGLIIHSHHYIGTQQKELQINFRIKWHCKSNELDRTLHNIPQNKYKLNILLITL
jgi:hypothetical protein